MFGHFLNIEHPCGTTPATKTRKYSRNGAQRHAAQFFHNDYKTIERRCMSEMIGQLNLEPLNIRCTNRRLTIFHKAINCRLEIFSPSEIVSQFCITLDISTTKHSIPSIRVLQIQILPQDNNILEFTTRYNRHYQRMTEIQISFNIFRLKYTMHPSPAHFTM